MSHKPRASGPDVTHPRRSPLLKDIRREIIGHEGTLGTRLIEASANNPLHVQATPDERIPATVVGAHVADTE